MTIPTDSEYEALRAELLEWQNRRFSLLGISVTVVTTLLGLTPLSDAEGIWIFTSSLLLIFLAIACLLTAYCGIVNIKIGTYLQVFYESKDSTFRWESRCFQISEKTYKYGNLNKHLSIIYFSLAIISLIMPTILFGFSSQNLLLITALAVTSVLFVIALVWLYKSQDARSEYIKKWEEVKENGTQ